MWISTSIGVSCHSCSNSVAINKSYWLLSCCSKRKESKFYKYKSGIGFLADRQDQTWSCFKAAGSFDRQSRKQSRAIARLEFGDEPLQGDKYASQKIMKVLCKYEGSRSGSLQTIKATHHKTDLSNETSLICQQPYCVEHRSREVLCEHVNKHVETGVVEPAQCEWTKVKLCIQKKDSTHPFFCKLSISWCRYIIKVLPTATYWWLYSQFWRR